MIRRMCSADLPQVAALEAAVQIQPWSHAQVLAVADLLHDNYMGWVVEDAANNKLIGYLLMQHMVDAFEILTLGVDTAQRRRGVAQQLCQQAWLEMRAMQPDAACFLEVRTSNLAAQNLYQKCGFKTIGQRKNYYQNPTEHALILEMKHS